MNIIFVSRIADDKQNVVTQIISSVPPVTIAAIAESKILNEENTSSGLYVIESSEDKNVVAAEIERYLDSNTDTRNFERKTYPNSQTIAFQW